MLTAETVARYFLARGSAAEDADFITNMKLQKLVYYAQAVHLAAYGTPLFNDRIDALTYGPVVKSLYQQYKQYERNPIPPPDDFDVSAYGESDRRLLDAVYEAYGQFAAWRLSDMTHCEAPWIRASKFGAEITQDSMKDYFGTKFGGFMTAQQHTVIPDDAIRALREIAVNPSTLVGSFDEIPEVAVF